MADYSDDETTREIEVEAFAVDPSGDAIRQAKPKAPPKKAAIGDLRGGGQFGIKENGIK